MPLFDFACPAGHVTTLLVRAPAPLTTSCDTCAAPARHTLAAPALCVVAGRTGPREGSAHVANGDGFRVVEETTGYRVRVKGASCTLADYRCSDETCTTTWFEVWDGDKPAEGPPCPTCSRVSVEVVGIPSGGWFTGRYFDRGLGMWIESIAHRRAVMAELGLVEAGEVDQPGSAGAFHDWRQKDLAQAEVERLTVRDMLRGFESGPDSAGLKRARDNGLVKDWSGLIEDVGGLD